ncbi:epoxide hydrolase 3-like [Clavelina lepadiformis]|uniref:epoxide hydrolase 3-like n=1 Tax=Clavelina lepadiformis TaxID=159417 RepID=UPI004042C7E7
MDLRKKAKQIVQPTLFIWGDKDLALDARMVPYCAKGVPRIKTQIVDGATHWVAQDEPEQVHELMKKFLEDNA